MIPRRVLVNLVVFGLLGLAVAAWAATNVLSLPVLTHPYDITAEFSSSPGLHADFQVAYLGVKVGQIGSVALRPGHAVVTLRINHGVHLPVGLSAAASRESPIGEPYVALSPPSGYRGGGPYVRSGYLIPVGATSVPLSYEDLFVSLDKLAESVSPTALNTLLHELALAVNGRGDDLRELLANASELTSTAAANAGQIDQLIGDLTTLTHTLAVNRAPLASSLDSLAALSTALAQSRQDIESLVSDAPAFAGQLNAVLAQSDGNLGCLLDGLGVVSDILSAHPQIAALEQLLQTAPSIAAVIPQIATNTPTGVMLKGSAHLNAGAPPALPIYATPSTLPAVHTAAPCPGVAPASSSTQALGAGAAGSAGGAQAARTVPALAQPGAATLHRASSTAPVRAKSYPLVIFSVLAIVALLALLTRPWRYLARRRLG